MTLTDGRYRMRPKIFSKLSQLQRFACSFLIPHITEEFTGYACIFGTERPCLSEGWFVNGALRIGISYHIGSHIEEGSFDKHGCFAFGQFDIWKPAEGQWVKFIGHVRPHFDFHDEGLAIWQDGCTYEGQFHYCDLHGFGTFKDQHGVTIASGLWRQNRLVFQTPTSK